MNTYEQNIQASMQTLEAAHNQLIDKGEDAAYTAAERFEQHMLSDAITALRVLCITTHIEINEEKQYE